MPAVTIPLPPGHRLDHGDHHNRQDQRDTVDIMIQWSSRQLDDLHFADDVIDWIMKTTTTGRNNGIQWTLWIQWSSRQLDDLHFVDDVIDWIMKTTTTGRNNGIQWTLWIQWSSRQLDDLHFADDLALLSHSHSQMQDKTTLLEPVPVGKGLKISRKKTEQQDTNWTGATSNKARTGQEQQEQPRTERADEGPSMAYAPLGATGLSK